MYKTDSSPENNLTVFFGMAKRDYTYLQEIEAELDQSERALRRKDSLEAAIDACGVVRVTGAEVIANEDNSIIYGRSERDEQIRSASIAIIDFVVVNHVISNDCRLVDSLGLPSITLDLHADEESVRIKNFILQQQISTLG